MGVMSLFPNSAAFITQRHKLYKQKQQTLKAKVGLLNQSRLECRIIHFV